MTKVHVCPGGYCPHDRCSPCSATGELHVVELVIDPVTNKTVGERCTACDLTWLTERRAA